MYSSLPQMLYEKAKEYNDYNIQFYKDKTGNFQPVKYSDFWETMLNFSAGLLDLGIKPQSKIGLISDNRKEWLVCSMGIMSIGCCDIPRGSEATVKDLSYILKFAEVKTAVIENNYSLKKIIECRAELTELENIILIDPSENETGGSKIEGISIFSYEEILEAGKKYRLSSPLEVENLIRDGKPDDTATIIFTSGTTGVPKGVELSHNNFICQIPSLIKIFPLKKKDKALCVLPVWHIYEREMEYYLLNIGASLCYSKPAAGIIMTDMKKISPQFMACVPRIWEAVYKALQKQIKNKSALKWVLFKTCTVCTEYIRKMHDIILGRRVRFKKPLVILSILNKWLYFPILFLLPFKALGEVMFFNKAKEILGGNFKIGMSGGGGLAPKLDSFFNSIGVKLVEGYGLTETAPMCCIRNYRRPVLGTIGKLFPFCQGKIIGKEGKECKLGQMGVLYVKGPHVMKGYYKQPELTCEVLNNGWFNTGDLVIMTWNKDIIIKGRQKDTIVLRSGENVEPFPIECKLEESPYISKAVVVGQDKKCLGALIIPSKDSIKFYAEQQGMDTGNMSAVLKSEKIRSLIFKEMEHLITPKNGFKSFEKIGRFLFLDKQFETGVELNAKQGIMRYKINEIYKWHIMLMFNDSSTVQNLSNLIPANLPNFSSLKDMFPVLKDKDKE